MLKPHRKKSYCCNKVKHFRGQFLSLFFPAERTGADHDHECLAEPGNIATEKWLLQSTAVTALTPSHYCVSAALDTPITAVNSSLRSGLITGWLGSPLTTKE